MFSPEKGWAEHVQLLEDDTVVLHGVGQPGHADWLCAKIRHVLTPSKKQTSGLIRVDQIQARTGQSSASRIIFCERINDAKVKNSRIL